MPKVEQSPIIIPLSGMDFVYHIQDLGATLKPEAYQKVVSDLKRRNRELEQLVQPSPRLTAIIQAARQEAEGKLIDAVDEMLSGYYSNKTEREKYRPVIERGITASWLVRPHVITVGLAENSLIKTATASAVRLKLNPGQVAAMHGYFQGLDDGAKAYLPNEESWWRSRTSALLDPDNDMMLPTKESFLGHPFLLSPKELAQTELVETDLAGYAKRMYVFGQQSLARIVCLLHPAVAKTYFRPSSTPLPTLGVDLP